jgi:hypothetical protein
MRPRSFMIAAMLLMTVVVTGHSQAQVNVGISVGDRDGFYLELGNFYRVPPREVMVIRDRHIDDDEIPVVFYFADAAGVPPVVVADLRHRGMSWRDIAFHFRLSPQIFYAPAYGAPLGFSRYRSYRDWRRIDMRDDDFVRFANVRFISKHYNRNPGDIIRMHDQNRDFHAIHNEVYHENGRNNGHHEGDRTREFNQGRDNRGRGHEDREAPQNNDSRPRRHGRERE